MNQMMKGQLNQYEVQSAMILGIACGNGLEHVDTDLKFTKEFTKIADKNMKTALVEYMGAVFQLSDI